MPTTVTKNGSLAPCPNLPTMADFALRDVLADRLGRDVSLVNDAAAFALGEWAFGAGIGTQSMVGVTLGTSVGLGIVMDGRVYSGSTGEAGEVWRSPVNLTGRERGLLHDHLRGSVFVDNYEQRTGIRRSIDEIAALAATGDRDGEATFCAYGSILGRSLAWVSNILDPEVIVLGGSVANSYEVLRPSVLAELRGLRVRLEVSTLGERAAILGATRAIFSDGEGDIT